MKILGTKGLKTRGDKEHRVWIIVNKSVTKNLFSKKSKAFPLTLDYKININNDNGNGEVRTVFIVHLL